MQAWLYLPWAVWQISVRGFVCGGGEREEGRGGERGEGGEVLRYEEFWLSKDLLLGTDNLSELPELVRQAQLLSQVRQYLRFCTSKASKLSTCQSCLR